MNKDRYRIGQRDAHDVVYSRLLLHEPYTAIILPTRYGKTDLARMLALDGWSTRVIATTLVLSPNDLLKRQVAKLDAFEEAVRRYEADAWGAKIGKVDKAKLPIAPNGEMFLSTTIQLVERNIDVFCQWVEYVIATTGLRPLIIIDECHTGSERNSWGNAVKLLVDAGALALLMTATAMRSDGQRIVGFNFKLVEEKEVTRYITRPGSKPQLIRIDQLAGVQQRLKLVPDYERTFRDAWTIETPSPLCKLTRRPFDVDMTTIKGLEREDGVLLSSLSAARTREVLGRVCREAAIIQDGCKGLTEELRRFRVMSPDIAGLIFCGNDDEPETRTNAHANAIRAALGELAPELTVIVATASDGNQATTKIENFAEKGIGDVLIVKQMASLGLDVPRAKVVLDLSPVRTEAAFIQRLMRVATPYVATRHAVYIAPDDCLSAQLFDNLVRDQGGEATVSLLELVHSYEKEREDKERTIYIPNHTHPGDIEDSWKNWIPAERWPDVEAVLETYPELTSWLTHCEVANRAAASLTIRAAAKSGVMDTAQQASQLRADINDIVKGMILERMRDEAYSHDRYRELSTHLFVSAYRAAGIKVGVQLSEITSLDELKAVKTVLSQMAGPAC